MSTTPTVRSTPKFTIGIDVGKQEQHLTVKDASGANLASEHVPNTVQDLTMAMQKWPDSQVIFDQKVVCLPRLGL